MEISEIGLVSANVARKRRIRGGSDAAVVVVVVVVVLLLLRPPPPPPLTAVRPTAFVCHGFRMGAQRGKRLPCQGEMAAWSGPALLDDSCHAGRRQVKPSAASLAKRDECLRAVLASACSASLIRAPSGGRSAPLETSTGPCV